MLPMCKIYYIIISNIIFTTPMIFSSESKRSSEKETYIRILESVHVFKIKGNDYDVEIFIGWVNYVSCDLFCKK